MFNLFSIVICISCSVLSWWKFLLYRKQSTDLLCNSMDWFLYDMDLHHKRVQRDADAMNYFSTLAFDQKKYVFACCVKIKLYGDWNNFLYLSLSTGEINVKFLSSLKICLDIANTCFPFENILLKMNTCGFKRGELSDIAKLHFPYFQETYIVTCIFVLLELHIPYCLFKVNISHCNIFTIFFLTLPYCDDVILGGDSLIKFQKWWEGHRVHIKNAVQSPLNVINIARLHRRIQKLVKHLR